MSERGVVWWSLMFVRECGVSVQVADLDAQLGS